MDDEEVRSALRTVHLEPTSVRPILGGWASWTYSLDEQVIVRFPRTEAVADATRRELALLPELARHAPFAVPAPSHLGTWHDRPFFAYPLIVGRGLRPADGSPALLRHLQGMLAALHSFPVDRAATLLGTGPPTTAWRRHLDRLWPIVEEHAVPVIPGPLATRVHGAFEAFLSEVDGLPSSLVHNDLGLEHLLVDEQGTELVGIIDFEDATIGDPAVDLVPLRAAFGPDALPRLLPDDGLGDRLPERLHFYRWMGSIHAIVYGVTQGVPAEVEHGLRELRRRFEAPLDP